LPSALTDVDDYLSDMEPLDGPIGRNKKDTKKRADKGKDKKERKDRLGRQDQSKELVPAVKRGVVYDPRPDVKLLQATLSRSRPDPKNLLAILPYLTSDELLALRAEYKNQVKMSGKGINLAKHIKVQVTGNFGKVCYATALGRWESEAHWANFWYRSNSTRRELLIEALVGRPNSEIREIKKAFRDKRYGDDIEKCMKAELKADKFRTGILLALEEKRQSDTAPLNIELVRRDVQDLHRALVTGSESGMIQIIVVRGNTHLREVLHVYEHTYHQNFAKEMIAKSQNLVVGLSLSFLLTSIFPSSPLPSESSMNIERLLTPTLPYFL
jgi:hypothetical protein